MALGPILLNRRTWSAKELENVGRSPWLKLKLGRSEKIWLQRLQLPGEHARVVSQACSISQGLQTKRKQEE